MSSVSKNVVMAANSFEDSKITEKYNAALNPEVNCIQNPPGVLPKHLGGGVRRASRNPYPISDQNM